MRRSRTATTALTGLLGLGTIIGLALPAQAESPAAQTNTKIVSTTGGTSGGTTGGIVAHPTTTTTKKPTLPKAPPAPAAADDVIISGIPTGPVDPEVPGGGATVNGTTGGGPTGDPCAPVASCPQDGQCTPGTTADPDCRPDDDCTPIPGAADPCDEDDCTPIPGASDHCPDPDDDCSDDDIARGHCAEPCDEGPSGQPRLRSEDCDEPCEREPQDHAVRSRDDDRCDDPCASDGGRPQQPRSREDDPERCDEGGTDGGTTGGTTGGGGRLPKTGVETMTIAGAGAALTAIGAALRGAGKLGGKRKRTA